MYVAHTGYGVTAYIGTRLQAYNEEEKVMEERVKVESSIPVQCRVSIGTLARLAMYWEGEGESIRSMSQLVSWSLYLMEEILRSNGKMGGEVSVEEARGYLLGRGLWQKSSMERSYKKIGAAIRFEGLRAEGIDPGRSSDVSDRVTYNRMHRAPSVDGTPSSVIPFGGQAKHPLLDVAMKVYEGIDNPEPIISGVRVSEDEVGVKEGMSDGEFEAKAKADEDKLKRETEEMNKILGIE